MKIGNKVRCLTSVFVIPPHGAIGIVTNIIKNCIEVDFPEWKKCIWLYKNEVEVIE